MCFAGHAGYELRDYHLSNTDKNIADMMTSSIEKELRWYNIADD
jgi:hypothetical protein